MSITTKYSSTQLNIAQVQVLIVELHCVKLLEPIQWVIEEVMSDEEFFDDADDDYEYAYEGSSTP